jgi:hypothetical protein
VVHDLATVPPEELVRYFPVLQAVQLDDPEDEKVPAGHFVHVVAPLPEKFPLWHWDVLCICMYVYHITEWIF